MESGDDLPRGIALAWGVAANPQRGPRRELSIEGIVDAAVAIADADGLGAVSMSAVAGALGFTTMSLYRYVSAKDDLVLLMQEAAIGLPPLSIADATGWRDGLERWYAATIEMYGAHPWVLEIPIEGEPSTPNNLAWLDAGLAVLEQTPLDHRARVSTMLLVSGNSRWEAQILRGQTTEPNLDPRVLAELVTPEQFPHLYPAMASGAYSDEGNPFEFGFARVLDGIAAAIAAVEGGGTPSALPVRAVEDPAISKDERVRKARGQVKEAEGKLRDARQKEREAVAKARERTR